MKGLSLLGFVEVNVFLDKYYTRNASFMVHHTTSRNQIINMCNERYGPNGWWYLDIID